MWRVYRVEFREGAWSTTQESKYGGGYLPPHASVDPVLFFRHALSVVPPPPARIHALESKTYWSPAFLAPSALNGEEMSNVNAKYHRTSYLGGKCPFYAHLEC